MSEWTQERLNALADLVEENVEAIEKTSQVAEKNSQAISDLREESKELNIRFSAYQQASQWVVNLAFGLLATATITTIVSAVVRR